MLEAQELICDAARMRHEWREEDVGFPDPHSTTARCSACRRAVCVLCVRDYREQDDCAGRGDAHNAREGSPGMDTEETGYRDGFTQPRGLVALTTSEAKASVATCKRCGAALLIHPLFAVDVMLLHDQWHAQHPARREQPAMAEEKPEPSPHRGRRDALRVARQLREAAVNNWQADTMRLAADEIDHLVAVIDGYRSVLQDWARDTVDRQTEDT